MLRPTLRALHAAIESDRCTPAPARRLAPALSRQEAAFARCARPEGSHRRAPHHAATAALRTTLGPSGPHRAGPLGCMGDAQQRTRMVAETPPPPGGRWSQLRFEFADGVQLKLPVGSLGPLGAVSVEIGSDKDPGEARGGTGKDKVRATRAALQACAWRHAHGGADAH
eukprot:2355630-Prymnesium_polylepis.1